MYALPLNVVAGEVVDVDGNLYWSKCASDLGVWRIHLETIGNWIFLDNCVFFYGWVVVAVVAVSKWLRDGSIRNY